MCAASTWGLSGSSSGQINWSVASGGNNKASARKSDIRLIRVVHIWVHFNLLHCLQPSESRPGRCGGFGWRTEVLKGQLPSLRSESSDPLFPPFPPLANLPTRRRLPLPLFCWRLMEWTTTCWRTGGTVGVWGEAWQKFGVQDMSGVRLRMTILFPNIHGRSVGKCPCCEDILLRELQLIFHSRWAAWVLSFTLSVPLPWGWKKANSQNLKVCEKTWLDRSSKCHKGEVVFRHETAFVLISEPVRRPFDVVFGWCPRASCLFTFHMD